MPFHLIDDAKNAIPVLALTPQALAGWLGEQDAATRGWVAANGFAAKPETRLALPPDPGLTADLTAPRYELRVSGIAVESKDEIAKRIGRSTDSGDAVALACWHKPEPRFVVLGES